MTWLWPFTSHQANEQQRVDQGWDLQGSPGAPILAVDAGTVGTASDPSGFGPDYPTLKLDNAPPGAPSHSLYYGHTDVDASLVGRHVNAGDIIGHTNVLGHNSPPGWLELGFGQDTAPGSPATPGAGPTAGGNLIKQLLTGAATGTGTPAGAGTSSSASSGVAGFGKLALEMALGAGGLLLIVLGAKRFTGGSP